MRHVGAQASSLVHRVREMSTMIWREITGLLIIAMIIAIFAYDLIADIFGGNSATISRICLDTFQRYPTFALATVFLFGMLCGHLFVPQHVGK